METDGIPVADGFDFPVGDPNGKGSYVDKATGKRHDGWYVATQFGEQYQYGLHPGEDWNGAGGGETDFGQPVHATAAGRIVAAGTYPGPWGRIVVIEHAFYENNSQRRIFSVYAHLSEIAVETGAIVGRRERLGAIGRDPDGTFKAHLHFELRWDGALAPDYWPSSNGNDVAWIREHYAPPTDFVAAHRSLYVPHTEPVLFVVDTAAFSMRVYHKGESQAEYRVAFGQGVGQKRIRDDLKTPRGMYFVVEKSRGPFSGEFARYFGGYWMKINYPNPYDAEWGRSQGLIDTAQQASISKAWSQRRTTLQDTKLGSGIGFHGWVEEWGDEGSRQMSFGCIVMHPRDVGAVFEQTPVGTMVVLL